MTQIDNPQQIYTLSLSNNDMLPFVQSNFPKIETLKSILHSSLLAIWKLSQENIVSFPTHKLLAFSLKSGNNMQGLAAINPKTIKQVLTLIVTKTNLKRNHNLPTYEENQREIIQKLFSLDTFKKKLRQQFQKILSKIMNSVKREINTSVNVEVQWKTAACLEIFQENYSLVKKCGNIHEIARLANPQKGQKIQAESVQGNSLIQFKQLLSKLSGNSKIKLDLYKLFQSNTSLLKSKELQIQQWQQCSHRLQETVNNQMNFIEQMSQEKATLENTIQDLKKQLKVNEDRIKIVQMQITNIESQLAELKLPPPQPYYINPFFEKDQLEQKMYMEMIEIESELLLKKDQIKLMSDSMIELVKACQNSLQDLRVSKYFASKFNRTAFTILKDIKSLQSYDLQSMLNIKQESIYGSEYFQETRKSLSNFSQLELDVKQSRIFTEDDSLSGQQ